MKYLKDLNEKEKKWLDNLGINEDIETAAEKVANDTNYEANGESAWKIYIGMVLLHTMNIVLMELVFGF